MFKRLIFVKSEGMCEQTKASNCTTSLFAIAEPKFVWLGFQKAVNDRCAIFGCLDMWFYMLNKNKMKFPSSKREKQIQQR